MPCSDVTEIIRLRLDGDGRFKSYTLTKKTCGGAVGNNALLETYFRDRDAEAIVDLRPDEFHAALDVQGDLEEFLALKHFFAVQIALEVLTGKASGARGEPCVAASVIYDGEELDFEADIPVDIATDRIRACGLCKNCPSAAKKIPGRESAGMPPV